MPFQQLGDLKMHYHVRGHGEPVVFINGLCGDLYNWKRLVPLMEKHHQLIFFDNRGSGLTEAPNEPFSMADLADDVAELITSLGLSRAHVLGWSMGGNVAQEVAIRHSDKVGALVLMSTYTKEPERSRFAIGAMMNSVMEGGSLETFQLMMQAWCSTEPSFRARATPSPFLKHDPKGQQIIQGFLRQKSALDDFCSVGRLQKISSPTLVVHGKEDIMVPIHFGEEVAAGIAGAEFITIDGAGHFLPPAGYSAPVLDFISRHPLEESIVSEPSLAAAGDPKDRTAR